MSWRKGSSLTWLRALPGVRQGEPLASRTSFGIGGSAEFFAEMANPQAIEVALEGCRLRAIPYLLLGAGTNLLVADAGVEGLVVRVVNRDYEVEGTGVPAGRRPPYVEPERPSARLPHIGASRRPASWVTRHRRHHQARARRWGGGQEIDGQADQRAQPDAADQDQELRQRFREPAGGFGRKAGPGRRAERHAARGGRDLAAARELHRQRRRRDCG